MTATPPAAAKTALRRNARARRKQLAAEHPEASAAAATRAPAMLAALNLDRPGVVAVYAAIGAELDPAPLGEALAAAGWTLALPASVDPQAPLAFRRWTPGEPLVVDAVGIQAPPSSAAAVRPDLVIVPLLAFDRAGGRLGQGGGHYDRTLAALRGSGPPPPFVGLAYAGQEAADLPREPHDQPLDGILTEAGYIGVRKDF
ncbi:5-formyltetrahydrofolate cyclo-ligase [Caulobacter mirabilis]|uniref:5-formyltetrahydrofolate cyclo-ligase n=1 Tax=Caulobacter mirabilis TaxID=69666 RepID=UPI001FE6627B|nr:5-formyltetrahydrofolate cyclo-ligase [Caulobacter mirabilis]